MSNAPNPKDYFSSFLASADAPASSVSSDSGQAGVEKAILNFLASREGPVSVREMLNALELPPSLAMEAVARLSAAQLIQRNEIERDECIALTDLGRRVSA